MKIKTVQEIGFSVRKGEYAQAFVRGEITPRKLIEASDEELMEMLTNIRGIGPWTVHMLSIFMLRRVDILPPADLGVQLGLVKFWLGHELKAAKNHGHIDVSDEKQNEMINQNDDIRSAQQSVTSLDSNGAVKAVPLPKEALEIGLKESVLRERLKKRLKKGNIYLTAKECEALTANWRPYRSIGVYYMWIIKGDKESAKKSQQRPSIKHPHEYVGSQQISSPILPANQRRSIHPSIDLRNINLESHFGEYRPKRTAPAPPSQASSNASNTHTLKDIDLGPPLSTSFSTFQSSSSLTPSTSINPSPRSSNDDNDQQTVKSQKSNSTLPPPPLVHQSSSPMPLDNSFHNDDDDSGTPPISPPRPPILQRSATVAGNIKPRDGFDKDKKRGVFSGFASSLSDLLQLQKKPEISTPYDPVHLTHVGFNSDTGEFTGLPKEWQQLLQDSGISKQDQEANPQAVMDIVAFYQDAQKAQLGAEDSQVWKKMGGVANGQPTGPVEKSFTARPAPPPPGPPTRYGNPRAAPPPPPMKKSISNPGSVRGEAPRPAPPPPRPAPPPQLDRSVSHRIPPNPTSASRTLERAKSQQSQQSKPAGPSSSIATPNSYNRAPPPIHNPQVQLAKQPSAASAALARAASKNNKVIPQIPPSLQPQSQPPQQQSPQQGPGPVPRRRENNNVSKQQSEAEIILKLQSICTDADPTKLYKNLWVPASAHPEISQNEYTQFVHSNSPPQQHATNLSRIRSNSSLGSTLSRRKSKLSRQYNPTEDDGVGDNDILSVSSSKPSSLNLLQSLTEETTKEMNDEHLKKSHSSFRDKLSKSSKQPNKLIKHVSKIPSADNKFKTIDNQVVNKPKKLNSPLNSPSISSPPRLDLKFDTNILDSPIKDDDRPLSSLTNDIFDAYATADERASFSSISSAPSSSEHSHPFEHDLERKEDNVIHENDDLQENDIQLEDDDSQTIHGSPNQKKDRLRVVNTTISPSKASSKNDNSITSSEDDHTTQEDDCNETTSEEKSGSIETGESYETISSEEVENAFLITKSLKNRIQPPTPIPSDHVEPIPNTVKLSMDLSVSSLIPEFPSATKPINNITKLNTISSINNVDHKLFEPSRPAPEPPIIHADLPSRDTPSPTPSAASSASKRKGWNWLKEKEKARLDRTNKIKEAKEAKAREKFELKEKEKEKEKREREERMIREKEKKREMEEKEKEKADAKAQMKAREREIKEKGKKERDEKRERELKAAREEKEKKEREEKQRKERELEKKEREEREKREQKEREEMEKKEREMSKKDAKKLREEKEKKEREVKQKEEKLKKDSKEEKLKREREEKEGRLKKEREEKEQKLKATREEKEQKLKAAREEKELKIKAEKEEKEHKLRIEREEKEQKLNVEREEKENKIKAEREEKEIKLRTERENEQKLISEREEEYKLNIEREENENKLKAEREEEEYKLNIEREEKEEKLRLELEEHERMTKKMLEDEAEMLRKELEEEERLKKEREEEDVKLKKDLEEKEEKSKKDREEEVNIKRDLEEKEVNANKEREEQEEEEERLRLELEEKEELLRLEREEREENLKIEREEKEQLKRETEEKGNKERVEKPKKGPEKKDKDKSLKSSFKLKKSDSSASSKLSKEAAKQATKDKEQERARNKEAAKERKEAAKIAAAQSREAAKNAQSSHIGFVGSLFGSKKKSSSSLKSSKSSISSQSSSKEKKKSKVKAKKDKKNNEEQVQEMPVNNFDHRYPIQIERAIYRLSHLKLANPRRSLYEQVLISNFMFWYLSIVNHQNQQQVEARQRHDQIEVHTQESYPENVEKHDIVNLEASNLLTGSPTPQNSPTHSSIPELAPTPSLSSDMILPHDEPSDDVIEEKHPLAIANVSDDEWTEETLSSLISENEIEIDTNEPVLPSQTTFKEAIEEVPMSSSTRSSPGSPEDTQDPGVVPASTLSKSPSPPNVLGSPVELDYDIPVSPITTFEDQIPRPSDPQIEHREERQIKYGKKQEKRESIMIEPPASLPVMTETARPATPPQKRRVESPTSPAPAPAHTQQSPVNQAQPTPSAHQLLNIVNQPAGTSSKSGSSSPLMQSNQQSRSSSPMPKKNRLQKMASTGSFDKSSYEDPLKMLDKPRQSPHSLTYSSPSPALQPPVQGQRIMRTPSPAQMQQHQQAQQMHYVQHLQAPFQQFYTGSPSPPPVPSHSPSPSPGPRPSPSPSPSPVQQNQGYGMHGWGVYQQQSQHHQQLMRQQAYMHQQQAQQQQEFQQQRYLNAMTIQEVRRGSWSPQPMPQQGYQQQMQQQQHMHHQQQLQQQQHQQQQPQQMHQQQFTQQQHQPSPFDKRYFPTRSSSTSNVPTQNVLRRPSLPHLQTINGPIRNDEIQGTIKLPKGNATQKASGIKGKYFDGQNSSRTPLLATIGGLFLIGYTLDYQLHLKHHKNNHH
ncbi:hypothetical protein E3Q17_03466 [Wallemia mellicola]|uniref:non-specific serine/threonine protein kinase n=1 Tax=Wallemia mellicola TaxID=1708541 RepID=A0A4T0NJJ9_9BASI|nr:hypothetical protein E3Q17_03466 [Wallemia mellicola]